jgi:ParB-like chromosome segregation protein Spo0J
MKNITANPASLKPNPWNSNIVSPENEKKIEKSIQRLGLFKPVLVRELNDGSLEIIGGEHRASAAVRLGMEEIPVINLGRIDDKKAKEISLIDNGRYGADDTLQLGLILEDLGDAIELAEFMPYSESDLNDIFSSKAVDLEMLDFDDDEDDSPAPASQERPIQTHQIMRFKVPYEDAAVVQAVIETIMKRQGFTAEDSLTNAGHALVHLCNQS